MEINMRIMAVTMAFFSMMLLSTSVNALERFAGLNDGSDENLKAVCKNYMLNSYLKNDPDLFFHLLPKSMKKREERLEKKWYENHLSRFGSEPLTEYELFEMKNEIEKSEHKGLQTKSIRIRFKAGSMTFDKGTSCYFKRHEDGRWYFGKKP